MRVVVMGDAAVQPEGRPNEQQLTRVDLTLLLRLCDAAWFDGNSSGAAAAAEFSLTPAQRPGEPMQAAEEAAAASAAPSAAAADVPHMLRRENDGTRNGMRRSGARRALGRLWCSLASALHPPNYAAVASGQSGKQSRARKRGHRLFDCRQHRPPLLNLRVHTAPVIATSIIHIGDRPPLYPSLATLWVTVAAMDLPHRRRLRIT